MFYRLTGLIFEVKPERVFMITDEELRRARVDLRKFQDNGKLALQESIGSRIQAEDNQQNQVEDLS